MQNWDLGNSKNIDEIIEEISSDISSRNEFLEYAKKNQRTKYLLQSIINRKNGILEETNTIHNKIISLQTDALLKQQKVKKINQLLIIINDYIEKNPETKPIETKPIETKSIETKSIDTKSDSENEDEDKDILKPLKKRKHNDDNMKEWMRERTDEEIERERLRVVKEIKKYRNVNFDALDVIKTISENDGKCKSIKVMDKEVLRIKYDENDGEQVRRFHRIITILRYLENCDMTPRLLYFNVSKLSIYMPYYGDIIINPTESQNRQIGYLIKKLKRNWGVYRIKDGKVMNNGKPNEFMMDKNGRMYLYDFNATGWIVDKDKPYPMKN